MCFFYLAWFISFGHLQFLLIMMKKSAPKTNKPGAGGKGAAVGKPSGKGLAVKGGKTAQGLFNIHVGVFSCCVTWFKRDYAFH